MATQKPIATISYNSEAFLREKLDIWFSAHIIQAYQYILHKGEDGDKDHIHLRIEPNKKLDPMDLLEQLREFPVGSAKPLCCRPFRPSKEEDWFLYAVHDKQYLTLKYGGGEEREKIPYSLQDIKTSAFYDVDVAFIRAKATLQHSSASMATQLRNGVNPLDLVLQGESVFTVNALMHAMQQTDYEKLASSYAKLSADYDRALGVISDITREIEKFGFRVVYHCDGEVEVIREELDI